MIACPRCGAPATIESEVVHNAQRMVETWMCCDNGHAFETRTVHATMLADAREMRSALNHINRRVALWARDAAIREDTRTADEVAEDHGLTATRVRQIRATLHENFDSPKQRKIRSSTQKGH